MDGVAGDPPGIFGCQKGDDATDIIRLRKALKRLHAERKLAARVSLGKIRHISLDNTGRDSVDADTAGAESEAKCFTRVSMAPLVAAYAGIAPTTPRAASDERRTTQLSFDRIGSNCCTRKKGALR